MQVPLPTMTDSASDKAQVSRLHWTSPTLFLLELVKLQCPQIRSKPFAAEQLITLTLHRQHGPRNSHNDHHGDQAQLGDSTESR